MLPKRETTDIIRLTAALAHEQGWSRVSAFADALAAADERTVLLLASWGTDAGPLELWARDAGAATASGEVEAAGPDTTLAAGRVVLALRCGRLLTPEVVERAALLRERPAGTYKIVMVGAEALREPGDLRIVERGAWRLLVGDPGEEWAGQDLAARHCLLWSDAEVAGFLTERVERDRAALREWLAAPPPGLLETERASYVIGLAEREHETRAGGQDDRAQRRVAAVRRSAAEGGRRLLRRMDADLATYERQVVASLRMLEQDLLNGVAGHLARHRDELSGRGAGEVVSRYWEQHVSRWRNTTAASFRAVAERLDQESALDDVDWALVNEVAPHPSGRPYPGVIVAGLRLSTTVPAAGGPAVAGPVIARPARPSNMPLTVAGGAMTAVLAGALGASLLPAAMIGAIGATGGHLVGRYLLGDRAEQEIAAQARAVIAASMAEIRKSVIREVEASFAAARRTIAGHFATLDEALAAAGGTTEPDTAGERLGELRRRLTATLK